MSNVLSIFIENQFGSIKIHGENNRTTLEIVPTFSGGGQEEFEQIVISAELDETQNSIEILIEVPETLPDIRVDLDVLLPTQLNLEEFFVETDLLGELLLEDIEFNDAVQFVQAEINTTITPITARNLKGPFNFSNVFTNIGLLAQVNDLTFTSDAQTGDSFVDVEIETWGSEGLLDINLAGGGSIDVSIPLGEGALLSLDAGSGSASIDSQFSFSGTVTPNSIDGTIGTGAPHQVLCSMPSGTITISPTP